ncbi:MAG: beta-aspartyl-peptidase [Thermovenabulum sp.]|uniref:beta-aspartyl-peptidase n=1 Tax=Thermovenabulum sp. TaxID=3100335 RepID=UPI003C7A3F5D
MFKILKGGRLFSPEDMGKKDILIAGSIIANIDENISPCQSFGELEVIDVKGKYVVPGFIDQHEHIIGGGGEGGFASRTPEVMLSDITSAGITTVVGCLGTDGTTRHMSSLLAKAMGLESEGISAYIYTGCYQLPTPTITGSVRDDIILIHKVLGAGEIAISDHRSAQPSKEDIKKLASEARVGGMLSGKAGVVHLHVGDGKEKLGMIFEIIEETEIPITQFTPTHINRNPNLLEDGIRFAKMGGIIDITSSVGPVGKEEKSIKPSRAIKYCIEMGVPVENITMSSDGNGSMPIFDEKGNFIGLTVAKPYSLYKEFKDLVFKEGLSLTDALKIITQNPAKSLKIYPKKGTLQKGSDADIVVLNEDLDIEYVFAKGRCMVKNKEIIVKGNFE